MVVPVLGIVEVHPLEDARLQHATSWPVRNVGGCNIVMITAQKPESKHVEEEYSAGAQF